MAMDLHHVPAVKEWISFEIDPMTIADREHFLDLGYSEEDIVDLFDDTMGYEVHSVQWAPTECLIVVARVRVPF